MIEIEAVNDAQSIADFVSFPEQLYRANPFWIPGTNKDDQQLAGLGDHGFYANADSRCFLAKRNGETVGRIAAIDHHTYQTWHNDGTGFFGFFECIDDQSVAASLFDTASHWLKLRDRKLIRGPYQPCVNYVCGIQVDGFNRMPTYGMPYNQEYYLQLLADCGFKKAKDLMSFAGHIEMLRDLNVKFEKTSKMAQQRFGFQLRHFDWKNFADDIRAYLELFNEVFPHHFSAVRVTDEEIDDLIESYRNYTVPLFTGMALLDEKVIGVVYGIPDLNPLLLKHNGKIPDNWREDEVCRAMISKVRIMVAVVKPEYNLWGVGPLLNYFILHEALRNADWSQSLKEVEYAWILEDNFKSRGTLQRGGAIHCRTHRLYSKHI